MVEMVLKSLIVFALNNNLILELLNGRLDVFNVFSKDSVLLLVIRV